MVKCFTATFMSQMACSDAFRPWDSAIFRTCGSIINAPGILVDATCGRCTVECSIDKVGPSMTGVYDRSAVRNFLEGGCLIVSLEDSTFSTSFLFSFNDFIVTILIRSRKWLGTALDTSETRAFVSRQRSINPVKSIMQKLRYLNEFLQSKNSVTYLESVDCAAFVVMLTLRTSTKHFDFL